jgi:hypothetical protein
LASGARISESVACRLDLSEHVLIKETGFGCAPVSDNGSADAGADEDPAAAPAQVEGSVVAVQPAPSRNPVVAAAAERGAAAERAQARTAPRASVTRSLQSCGSLLALRSKPAS